jgi:hypothetical protein
MDPIEINELIERESNWKNKGLTYLVENFSFWKRIKEFGNKAENLIKGYFVLINRKINGTEIDYRL